MDHYDHEVPWSDASSASSKTGDPAQACRDGTAAANRQAFQTPSRYDLMPPPLAERPLVNPVECQPRRQPRGPKWLPGRDRRDAGTARARKVRTDWGRATIVAAPDAGAVRIGMNWRKSFVTSAVFCLKSGRPMFFEGPHEIASYRRLAILDTCTDVQFQPLALHWEHPDGTRGSYFVDSVAETAAGTLVFRENKAHTAYFEDPEINAKLSAAEAELTRHPLVSFEREVGSDLMHPLRWRIVKDIFDDRTVAVDDRQRHAVSELLAQRDEVELGRIWDAIGGDRDDAKRIANAMLARRIIGHRIDRVPVADTRVVAPRRPARPGLLRSFLRQFAPKPV